jgi:negative regulator of sigma E activity
MTDSTLPPPAPLGPALSTQLSTPLSTQLSRFLDSDLSAGECSALLARLATDREARDQLTVLQLVRDAVAGVRALDDGYTRRILERVRREGRPRSG